MKVKQIHGLGSEEGERIFISEGRKGVEDESKDNLTDRRN